MKNPKTEFDQSFLATQRRVLIARREALRLAKQGTHSEASAQRLLGRGEAHEYEDEAQRLDSLEVQGNLEVRDDQRLSAIERALQKLDEGTYGISDESGALIPRERLESVPEAIYTLAEQNARERSP